MAVESQTARGQALDRLATLSVQADLLWHEYHAVHRDRTLPHSEQLAALTALATEMKAVLTEAQGLIYP